MTESLMIPDEVLISKMYLIRGVKVMIDSDLSELYNVETKRINEQCKRNINRFPSDFMFQLSDSEFENLKSQIATSSWGGRRTAPFVFTEHGILMLSSVLSSEKAIDVNIQIVRIFTQMREMLLTHIEILLAFEEMKNRVDGQDERLDLMFSYLKQFINQQKKEILPIGYKKGQ